MDQRTNLNASFRDPSGYVFLDQNGTLKRSVKHRYSSQFDAINESGLGKLLTSNRLLVEFDYEKLEADADDYAIVTPEKIKYISYPNEWSFAQLQDAAVLTLDIALLAMDYGMILKDASAYNIQFNRSKPIFIDILSFDFYEDNQPWVAYRQFCRHFLAPLALMSYVSPETSKLWLGNVDGFDLELSTKILPLKSLTNFGIFSHLFLHSRSESKNSGTNLDFNIDSRSDKAGKKFRGLSKNRLITLLNHLRSTVKGLKEPKRDTEWGDYYSDTNYTDAAALSKKNILVRLIKEVNPSFGLDIGCNIGEYSKLLRETCDHIVAWDIDHTAIHDFYKCERDTPTEGAQILPLVLDIYNPTPSIGWACSERDSAFMRGKPDLIMALALVHHLAISNNVPFKKVAAFFADACDNLIIEYVPKIDTQVRRLLQHREDIFHEYTVEKFELEFTSYFNKMTKEPISESDRILYLFRKW